MRIVILIAALAFILLFAAVTIAEIVKSGFDVLTAASLLIVAMFSFGILGALFNRPEE